ncbi:MAG: MFS transporter [Gammaproteobacteria bacterium]|uniref:MFS transporter n=1 Tax=Rhodoferax sp. TaxID=50421 RepID=UPI0017966880|nr:MFS transporter [Rhodoferax sp.]MBU3897894.1 MFS transporter [Gammaproteobacteria bacterium]MBA3057759.1 MFS transporter [Rhodoferax sp.]MBU3998870.1 MFS transporter [Gammaproteobacteria bacterium]MBU4019465.1 MFS transporter [Gammaproteobacteria bacterium]MBU4080787.1 MFS transporter [Gammaproteobacteria bacterium]
MPKDPATAPVAPLPKVLWPLLFGNFVIGTGVMVVPGTLNDISTSLAISVAAAGQLITAAAVVMFIGAPLFASVVAGWDRRRLLALSLLWYGVFLGLSALMPSFAWLMVMRVLTVLAPAIFTPQAAACVGLLVAPHQRGRAITFIFLGWSVASVLGLPLGAWIGGTLGWRSAFALVALLSLISALWLWRALPNGIKPPALSRAAWGETLQSKALMLCVLVTLLYSAGQFVLFSYFAPYFKAQLQATPVQLSLLFAWFGAFGLIGNIVMSRQIERIGAARAVMWGVGSMAVSLLLWPLGTSLMLAALIAIPWGLGCFSSNSAQQARLVGIAPALASGSIALNTSAMYAGQALGAGSGGWLIAHGGMNSLHWFGLAGLLAAMAVSWWAARQSPHGAA